MADSSSKMAIHIDEETGRDTADSDGSESKPFKTLQYAYLQQRDKAQYLTKQKEDDATQATYKPAAKSALKKAANFADAQKKKAAKEQELAIRQQKEDEERSKALEEAKKIVIKEDSSLPKAVRIPLSETRVEVVRLASEDKEGNKTRGSRVQVIGRVHRERKQKEVLFITLRDGHG